MYSNWDLAEAFAEGATKGKSARAFIEGDTFYSFGKHFIVAIRSTTDLLFPKQMVITTKGYSRTTSVHKKCVRDAAIYAGYAIKEDAL